MIVNLNIEIAKSIIYIHISSFVLNNSTKKEDSANKIYFKNIQTKK